jgi:hypothetical protein
MPTNNKVPGTLWVLPILFGVVGGAFASIIADLKYHAPWKRYLAVGVIISVIGILIGVAVIHSVSNLENTSTKPLPTSRVAIPAPKTTLPPYSGKTPQPVGTQDPVFPISPTINIDQPSTYPPMPAGKFLYVDEYALRQHYEIEATISEVISASKSGMVTRTAVATVILFTDGTGLVMLAGQPVITAGKVRVHYSVPPSVAYMEPTVVLIHSLTKAN